MGVLSRFGKIMEANINALLDKCEDPEKMIDQTLRDLNENLADVKKETAGVMAEESRCARELQKHKDEVTRWQGLAEKAVLAGNDTDAKQFLAKKQAEEQAVVQAQKVYDLAHSNATKMRQMHDKLVTDINTLRAKRDNLKGIAAVTKAQQAVNKAMSSDKSAGTLAAMDNLEEKINKQLDQAMAEAELNAGPVDEASDLAAKYESGQVSGSVDDELAALKAKLGK